MSILNGHKLTPEPARGQKVNTPQRKTQYTITESNARTALSRSDLFAIITPNNNDI